MEGYIRLYRKLLENPVVCKDSEHIAVWIYLLLNSTHKEYDLMFNGKRITMQPGQLLTGRKSISSSLKISESKVQRILKTFEIEQQIEQQTTTKNRLISILSWNEYQYVEQQNEQQVNNNRTTSEQQVNTNNNVKNIKNVKNKDNDEIEDFFESVWQIYPRKEGKGSISKIQKKKLYKIGFEEMSRAINRYKLKIQKEGIEKKYIKQGSTFFKSGYIDYLDSNSEEVKPKPKKQEIKIIERDYLHGEVTPFY